FSVRTLFAGSQWFVDIGFRKSRFGFVTFSSHSNTVFPRLIQYKLTVSRIGTVRFLIRLSVFIKFIYIVSRFNIVHIDRENIIFQFFVEQKLVFVVVRVEFSELLDKTVVYFNGGIQYISYAFVISTQYKLIVNAVVQEFIDAGNEIIVFIVRKHVY